jgi:nucleotide-binding universal stress UspA family protein
MPAIVAASDGRASAAGALRVVGRLAKRDGRTPALVTIGDAATGQRARALLDLVVDLSDDWIHTVVVGDARDALDALARVDGRCSSSASRSGRRRARRAVLAVDFGRASLRAATLALQLLDRPAHAFVVCPGSPDVDALVDVSEDSLARDAGVTVERRRIAGEPAAAILDVAVTERADLISLGRHGLLTPTGIIPASLGPAARTVLSAASCSVLVAPPD